MRFAGKFRQCYRLWSQGSLWRCKDLQVNSTRKIHLSVELYPGKNVSRNLPVICHGRSPLLVHGRMYCVHKDTNVEKAVRGEELTGSSQGQGAEEDIGHYDPPAREPVEAGVRNLVKSESEASASDLETSEVEAVTHEQRVEASSKDEIKNESTLTSDKKVLSGEQLVGKPVETQEKGLFEDRATSEEDKAMASLQEQVSQLDQIKPIVSTEDDTAIYESPAQELTEMWDTDTNLIRFTSVEEKAMASLKNQISYLDEIKPALPVKSFSLAPYVNHSETLIKLVELGVNLSLVEKHAKVASHILKADFETDLKPHIAFLYRLGIAVADLGQTITRNPRLLIEHLDDLEVRVNYLRSKKFEAEAIKEIVRIQPKILSLTTKELDSHLGFLQRELGLTGNEVRAMVLNKPKVAIDNNWTRMRKNQIYLTDLLGFSKTDTKTILVKCPALLLDEANKIQARFEYAHEEMGYGLECIVHWPLVLKYRRNYLKTRHSFLEHIGRTQVDPKKPNYIPLVAFGPKDTSDKEFCERYAKVPIQQYNKFLKTL